MLKSNKHNEIQRLIVETCNELGIKSQQEYKGSNWRADVFIPNDIKPIAFEIQVSPQSLAKTIERQSKFQKDGVFGCWLFEKPVSKLTTERPDLPVFYIEEDQDSKLCINIGDRRKVDLADFLRSFIEYKIQFKTVIQTKVTQNLSVVYYEMLCWNCRKFSFVYFVESPFFSSCNALIKPKEKLWESNKVEYIKEVVEFAMIGADKLSNNNFKLTIGEVKNRFSRTMNKNYISFGCWYCDSIFGDFHIMEAQIEAMYDNSLLKYQGQINLANSIELKLPHWCFPEDGCYCL